PRIHGELLKLGFTVSERTVSRYLPDRRTRRSQTWRTFLANHIGNLAFTATVTSSFATSDEDVDASVLLCPPVRPSCAGPPVFTQWVVVDGTPAHQATSLGRCVAQDQLRRRTRTRFSSGKDHPGSCRVEPCALDAGLAFLTSLISGMELVFGSSGSDIEGAASASASFVSLGLEFLPKEPDSPFAPEVEAAHSRCTSQL